MTPKKHARRVEFRIGGAISNTIELKITRKDLVSSVTSTTDLPSGEYLPGFYEGAGDATVGHFLACGFDFSVK